MPRIDGSFRDPWGSVFDVDGRIFRTLSPEATSELARVEAGAFLNDAWKRGWLISARPVDHPPFEVPADHRVVEHPRVPVISFPWEWSFGQMRAAALLHLDLQRLGLEHGVVLRDAAATNIQFVDTKPVFIDYLSVRAYRPGEYWTAHQQFVSQFLAPLVLASVGGLAFQPLLRAYPDGIPLDQTTRMLPWWKWLSPTLWVHLLLPDLFQRRSRTTNADELRSITRRTLPPNGYRALLDGLHGYITALGPPTRTSTWSDYAEQNTYEADEAEAKSEFIRSFIAEARPAVVVDIGCNTGTYAEAAIRAGAGRVIGLDLDPAAVHRAYERALRGNLPFLPLVQDLANPSPALGWRLRERPSLFDRLQADAVIALALEHHLILGRNVPPGEFLDWLLSVAPRGVVEFVQKRDPTVQVMLALREDIFPWYSAEDFAARLALRARIVRSQVVTRHGRTLFWYDARG